MEAGLVLESNVRCNLCGAVSHEVMPDHSELSVNQLRARYDSTFVRCNGCGLMFYSPRITESYALTLMSNEAAEKEADHFINVGTLCEPPIDGDPEKQKAILVNYYKGIFDRIADVFEKANGRPPRSWFEVAAAVGWMTHAANERAKERWGYGLEVAGCDANPYSAKVAKEHWGFDIRACIMSAYQLAPFQLNHYDIVVGFDFLEHTYTPLDDLKKLYSMTAPGGVIAMKTFIEELDPKGTMVHPAFHHYHFTSKTLRRIFEDAGFVIEVFDDVQGRVYAQVTVIARKPENG